MVILVLKFDFCCIGFLLFKFYSFALSDWVLKFWLLRHLVVRLV